MTKLLTTALRTPLKEQGQLRAYGSELAGAMDTQSKFQLTGMCVYIILKTEPNPNTTTTKENNKQTNKVFVSSWNNPYSVSQSKKQQFPGFGNHSKEIPPMLR